MKFSRLVGAVTETKFRWFLKIAMGQFGELWRVGKSIQMSENTALGENHGK